MAKDVNMVKEYVEKNAAKINECPEDLLGEKNDDNEVLCELCYEDVKIWDAKSLRCNHWFCDNCWKEQIQANIGFGKLWSEFRCLQNKCRCLMGYDFFKSLNLDQDKKLMYLYFKKIGQAIAQNSPTIIGCKVKDCIKYIELPSELLAKDFQSKQAIVKAREKELGYSTYKEKYPCEDHFCFCYNNICIGCEEMGHEPAKCEDANKWRKNVDKKKNELSDLWIMRHTKKCPHCGIPTEKNQGCDHMCCRQCKKHWCWICESGDWQNYNHKCKGEDLNKKQGSNETLKKDKLELLEKCIELYAQSDYSCKINIATAFNTDFEQFKHRNEVYERFNGNTLERFFITLKKANKICIKTRSFITWTYPIGFAMENFKELIEFNVERAILKGFLESLNFFIERPDISAILWAIDETLFKEQKSHFKWKKVKNALYTYEENEIIESFADNKYNDDF